MTGLQTTRGHTSESRNPFHRRCFCCLYGRICGVLEPHRLQPRRLAIADCVRCLPKARPRWLVQPAAPPATDAYEAKAEGGMCDFFLVNPFEADLRSPSPPTTLTRSPSDAGLLSCDDAGLPCCLTQVSLRRVVRERRTWSFKRETWSAGRETWSD